VQRKLKYIDALVKYIQLHNKQDFSVYLNGYLLNKMSFNDYFIIYNGELIKI